LHSFDFTTTSILFLIAPLPPTRTGFYFVLLSGWLFSHLPSHRPVFPFLLLDFFLFHVTSDVRSKVLRLAPSTLPLLPPSPFRFLVPGQKMFCRRSGLRYFFPASYPTVSPDYETPSPPCFLPLIVSFLTSPRSRASLCYLDLLHCSVGPAAFFSRAVLPACVD